MPPSYLNAVNISPGVITSAHFSLIHLSTCLIANINGHLQEVYLFLHRCAQVITDLVIIVWTDPRPAAQCFDNMWRGLSAATATLLSANPSALAYIRTPESHIPPPSLAYCHIYIYMIPRNIL